MPYVKVGQENSGSIDLHYEDHGSGRPVVLIHGYPLSGRAWDRQVPGLLEAGHRVITYDRRGFGNSSQPASGYEYDTFAADLKILLDTLDLHEAVLVGHSMGTGEVTRYLGAYGSARVAQAVLISPIPPYLLQADDNPEGLPGSLFDGFIQTAQADTPAWMKGFLDNFYNMDVFGGTLVSDQAFQVSWNVASAASAAAAVACIPTWETDFRGDLPKIDVPVLVVQGDADRILPYPNTGKRLPSLIKDIELVVIAGGRTLSPGPMPTRSTRPSSASSNNRLRRLCPGDEFRPLPGREIMISVKLATSQARRRAVMFAVLAVIGLLIAGSQVSSADAATARTARHHRSRHQRAQAHDRARAWRVG